MPGSLALLSKDVVGPNVLLVVKDPFGHPLLMRDPEMIFSKKEF